MSKRANLKEIESVVIRFSGDSGDGMQLTGTQFSDTSALMGNDISTFPDFPAEIRAPQGTVAGVSGFQVHIGASEINTPGDEPFVLVAMNPAALKANLAAVQKGGVIIINSDNFTERNYEKAGITRDPLTSGELEGYQLIKIAITSQTLEALSELDLDARSKSRCKNFYALGVVYHLFDRTLESTLKWIENKFSKNPELVKANILALRSGRNFAETLEAFVSTYHVPKAKIGKGRYRSINGNTATAWGLMRAAEVSGLPLFLGSYPITPASDILHELSKHKNFDVRAFQAEDEIASITSAIGASFGGALAVTTSSGPGIALKGEALGLAVTYELPLVVIDIQRGGPSTGLPTKTEQSDLMQVLYGRNGESPLIVLAASRPYDCFEMAFEAARLSLEHMTPVVLLTDGFIANGAEPWRIPDLTKEFTTIKPPLMKEREGEKFLPYKRDQEKLARSWAIPGTPGLEHRLGGLEKQVETGNISYDPLNHEQMSRIRQEKVDRVAKFIPKQKVMGKEEGELLVVSWGGTFGPVSTAVQECLKKGADMGHMHLKYINPMPENVEEILSRYKKILVCELNLGQMQKVLNAKFACNAKGHFKIQGQPFKVKELVDIFELTLEGAL